MLAKLATLCPISALLLVVATAAGAAPFLVKDINPGPVGRCGVKGSDPREGATVGDSFFFNACGAYGDCQLWKTDGTPAGTVQVSHNLATYNCQLSPSSLTAVDGRVFFVAGESGGANRPSDEQLWVSDGTSAGTVRLTDFPDFAYPGDLIEMAGYLFFTVWNGSPELWRSDGTASGTVPLMSFPSWENPENFDLNSWDLTNVDGTLFFSRCQKVTGCELWKSDGTVAGTVRVAVITPPGSYDEYPLDEDYDWGLVQFTPLDDRLFFAACEDAFQRLGNCELWQSDGSEAGTVRVMPFFPGIPPDDLYEHEGPYPGLAAANGRVFFQSCQPHASGDWSCGLWKSDGTPGGTVQVLDFGPVEYGTLTTVGETLFLGSGGSFWGSDGTAAGTMSLGVQGSRWTDVRGTLLFDRYDPVARAYHLWRSDGTEAGTFALDDFSVGVSGEPLIHVRILGELNGTLFLNIYDQERGAELFGLPVCGGEPGPCDPMTGECASPPWTCDGDPSTADACNPGIGCTCTLMDDCPPMTTSTTTSTTTTTTSTTSTLAPSTTTTASTSITTTSTSTTSTTTTTSTLVVITSTSSTLTPASTTSTTVPCVACDDGDPCTLEICAAGRCRHEILDGLEGIHCRLRHSAGLLACEGRISTRIEHRLNRARRLVKRADEYGEQRGARRLVRMARRRLRTAQRLLARRDQSACAEALERAVREARRGMTRWLATTRPPERRVPGASVHQGSLP